MAALALARQGQLIDFVSWGNSEPADWLRFCEGSIRYLLYPKGRWLSALRYLAGVIGTAFSTRPDCVYVQGAQQVPFALLLLFLARQARIIYHTQDYIGPGQNRFYEVCERVFARYADWVISNEPNRARFMASSYGLKRVPEVIRTALPAWWKVPEREESYRREVLRALRLPDGNQSRLIAAGGPYSDDRMSPQLLESLVELPTSCVTVFTNCPPGSTARRLCEEQISRLGLKGRALFWQAPNYEQLLRFFSVCDLGILLYPNSGIGHFYQCPGRLTEYLRCGLPIVTSQFPGLELLVLKYRIGEVVDPYNPKMIGAAIRRIVEVSESKAALRGQSLRKLAETELAYDMQALPVFNKILIGGNVR